MSKLSQGRKGAMDAHRSSQDSYMTGTPAAAPSTPRRQPTMPKHSSPLRIVTFPNTANTINYVPPTAPEAVAATSTQAVGANTGSETGAGTGATAMTGNGNTTTANQSHNANNDGMNSSQQQQNNPTTQPAAPAGSLFGGGVTGQSSVAGSLFGGPAAAAQQQQSSGGGGLFGNTATTTSQPQQTTSLFGASTSQPAQTGSLFGNAQTTTQTGGGGGLFGGSLAAPPQQTQQQAQQPRSLFGNTLNPPAQQSQQTTSLFGASTTAQAKPTTSLFGGNTNTTTTNTAGPLFNNSIFGPQNTTQTQQHLPPQNTIFGLSASHPASMLSASQYTASNYPSFAGKLTMGQSSHANNAQQSTTGAGGQAGPHQQSAVKINFDNLRPTTRYADCIPEAQQQLENVDAMIRAQERFAKDIEAFVLGHGEAVKSLEPDVSVIKEKAEQVEGALALDAGGVLAARSVLEKDRSDERRCERVVGDLSLPIQFRYSGYTSAAAQQQIAPSAGGSSAIGMSSAQVGVGGAKAEDEARDLDLVGNFFNPLTKELETTLLRYESNLAEIEAHMRVIEASAVMQAQQLAVRRAGGAGGEMGNGGAQQPSAEQTVRELADTLRGFEASILGAASLVGQCREGVNGLMLGRLGGVVGGGWR